MIIKNDGEFIAHKILVALIDTISAFQGIIRRQFNRILLLEEDNIVFIKGFIVLVPLKGSRFIPLIKDPDKAVTVIGVKVNTIRLS